MHDRCGNDVTIHNLVDKKVGISWQKGFNILPAIIGVPFNGVLRGKGVCAVPSPKKILYSFVSFLHLQNISICL